MKAASVKVDAAAVQGLTLVKGPHECALGWRVITVKRPDGRIQAIPYDYDQIARPIHIEAMINYVMGISNPDSRAAAHEYCLTFIRGWNALVVYPEVDGKRIGEMEALAWAFVAGYEHAKAPAGSPIKV